MPRNDVMLYLPREVGEGENKKATIYYKGIKDFKVNNNGTITFKTQKFGTITTPLLWRLSEGLAEDAPAAADPAPQPVGGHFHRGY